MKPSNLLLSIVPIVLGASLAGCVVGDDAGPHLGTQLKALTKQKWVSCWVRPSPETDPDFALDALECSAPIGDGGPFSPQIVGLTAQWGDKGMGEMRLHTSEPKVVARIPRAGFPVELRVQVIVDTRNLSAQLSLDNGIGQTLTIPKFDTYTNDKPLGIEQPIDIWPVKITVDSDLFAPALEDYEVTLPAGYTVLTSPPTTPPTTKITVYAKRQVAHKGDTLDLQLIAPQGARVRLAGTAMTVRSNTAPRTKVEIDGPGAYVVDATGFHRAADAATGMGTSTHMLDTCPGSWRDDGVCDRCLSDDPDCHENNMMGCEAQWRGDAICDSCLGNDPDCNAGGECPASWRGDGVCDVCLGNDPDCTDTECPAYWQNDGVCDPCLGDADHTDCTAGILCPIAWRADGHCDACLGDDPDCDDAVCPASWRGDGICDECLGDDPDCAGPACPAEWRNDGICDACLGDDPDCTPACPVEWYGDGVCDECLTNDPDCDDGGECPWSWYDDGYCDPCLGDDPDCI